MRWQRLFAVGLVAVVMVGVAWLAETRPARPAGHADAITSADYAALRWRLVGPFRGGRVLAVSGIPGNSTDFYFGSVDGGVWKTNDAGRTWQPIFDGKHTGSIGAIAVAASDPRIIYVGSGEADMRSDITYGDGVYKTTDGGSTWQHQGLEDTQQIGRVVVDPHNANRVFVAALGHAYAANPERGVFRSTDGGLSWRKVLFVNDGTGAVDLAMSPANPNLLFAVLWQTRRPPWNIYQPSTGPASGLFRSTDGGATWTRVSGHGLPSAHLGRMGIAFAPSNPTRIYLIVDATRGGLYRSDNSGRSWRLVSSDARLWDRGWYFCGIAVDPKNADKVYINDTAMYRSTDGGKTFTALKGSPDGDDFHTLWIDPNAPERMISGSDQGASISLNGGATWSTWYNQPTGQFYHVATDYQFPATLYGAQQDSGAAAALSRSAYSSLTFRDWRAVTVGGESDMLAPDPLDPAIVYGGRVDRYDMRTAQDQVIDPTLPYPGIAWRETWTLPLVFSPADRRTLYFGRQVLFRTRDSGKTWKIISPDLSRPDPGVPPNLDASAAADNLGIGPRRGVIYSIAPSPLRADMIWAGTDDGSVWMTVGGGVHWKDVSPPQLTPWSKVAGIEASSFDPDEAYVAIDRHRLDDKRPYIYRTRNAGATWELVTEGIAYGSYVNAVREDPVARDVLYAGTETGVVVSFDDGDRWLPLQLNLPTVSVRDIAIRGDSLALATHGRGFWILDDLAPLRQMSDAAVDRPTLFAPAPAVRVRPGDDQAERLPPDEPAAQNPPTGAIVDYELRALPTQPLRIEIHDAAGRALASWSSAQKVAKPNPNDFPYIAAYLHHELLPPAHVGLDQFVWDFHMAPLQGAFSRPSDEGPLAPPGRYSVRLFADKQTLSQPFVIARDPRVPASDADLLTQYDLALSIERQLTVGNGAYHRALQAITKIQASHTAGAQACVREIRAAVGSSSPTSPDNSMGYPEMNLSSVHYLTGQLKSLYDAVESADGAPTPDDNRSFAVLKQGLSNALGRLPKSACGVTVR